MAIYYMETASGEIYELDGTISATERLSSKITTLPVSSGSDITDNVKHNNTTISFQGIITDIKSRAGLKSTQQFISGIKELRESKEVFNVIFGDEALSLDNCLMESVEFSQSGKIGTLVAGEVKISSYNVTFSFKQVRVVDRAGLSLITADELKDIVQAQKEANGVTEFEDPKLKSRSLNETGDEYINDANVFLSRAGL